MVVVERYCIRREVVLGCSPGCILAVGLDCIPVVALEENLAVDHLADNLAVGFVGIHAVDLVDNSAVGPDCDLEVEKGRSLGRP